jgi:hypothetical protein
MWRKRVGVEPTIRPAKDRITGFEGRERHRTLFASGGSIAWKGGVDRIRERCEENDRIRERLGTAAKSNRQESLQRKETAPV